MRRGLDDRRDWGIGHAVAQCSEPDVETRDWSNRRGEPQWQGRPAAFNVWRKVEVQLDSSGLIVTAGIFGMAGEWSMRDGVTVIAFVHGLSNEKIAVLRRLVKP